MSSQATSNVRVHSCPYCSEFVAVTEKLLLQHIRLIHANESGFNIQCSYSGCGRTFHNFRTYQNHLLKHPLSLSDPSVLVETTPEDDSASGSSLGPQAEPQSSLVDPEGDETTASGIRPATPIDFYPVLTFEQLQKSNALWVLKVSETRQLSRTAVSGIVQDTYDLISGIMCEVKRQVDHTLSANGVDPAILARVFHPENPCLTPFEGIRTFHQQLQYYRKNFNLVEPVQITLKESHVVKISGRKRRLIVKKDEMVYIPLLLTLERLLNNDNILNQVMHRDHQPIGDQMYMYDFCSGTRYSSHSLFGVDSTALQIILYYDELEICNPLGSRRKKHKIGAFYYLLGNLPPKYRSSLKSIQLIALVKSSFISTYGIDRILKPLVSDLKQLEAGTVFDVGSSQLTLRGTVSIVSADNPASSLLGGFKQSGSAFDHADIVWVPTQISKQSL